VTANVSGAEQTSYGFTAEYTDSYIKLIYLRSRMYSPYLNQFIQPDTIVPDPRIPADWNKYAYVRNNPINFTDPSGQTPYGAKSYEINDARDLTQWLYNEMIWNARNDPDVKRMQVLNVLSEMNACLDDITYLLDKGLAFTTFFYKVRNGAPWDFKDEIGLKIGPGITLCTSSQCHNNIEFSVPGNIFYGYIGMASEFRAAELKWGAGWAEKHDPSHNPNKHDEYVGPYNGVTDQSSPNPIDWNLGDEPRDNVAVTLGMRMWIQHKDQLTLSQFKSMLGLVIAQLDHHAPRKRPVDPAVASNWPYPVGYFNNVGNVYNITKEIP
jgi:RHS repeat-associated protein